MSTEDTPPHLVMQDGELRAAIPRPIEAAAVHFRAQGRCFAAMVVEVIAEDPLSPDFVVDLVVFQPRDRRRSDRFSNASAMPGHVRWANALTAALPALDGSWQEMTWHYPGRQCLPEVVLRGASDV